MTNEEIFRSNLRIVRTANGYSAKELAELCKLKHPKRILDIEEGRLSAKLHEVIIICSELNVSVDSMLTKKVKIEVSFPD